MRAQLSNRSLGGFAEWPGPVRAWHGQLSLRVIDAAVLQSVFKYSMTAARSSGVSASPNVCPAFE